ncbi:hypothetical protein niasHT_010627 [Heterodera trifolii]|uniref:Uncharacterized protein n=1 Tax=Heterodera trifolii TaxID=157864 RepID=A0ABD2L2K9_9BILA
MSTPYIGSKISLISRLDIRYEGTLYQVDPLESTISLSQVRSFGTEDRPAPVPVPARAEVYDFIIFKASDIKDLIVCEETPPKEPSVVDITYDPAIVSVSKPPVAAADASAPQQPVQQPSVAEQLQRIADDKTSQKSATSPQPAPPQPHQPQQQKKQPPPLVAPPPYIPPPIVPSSVKQPPPVAGGVAHSSQQQQQPSYRTAVTGGGGAVTAQHLESSLGAAFGQRPQRSFFNRSLVGGAEAKQSPQQQQQQQQPRGQGFFDSFSNSNYNQQQQQQNRRPYFQQRQPLQQQQPPFHYQGNNVRRGSSGGAGGVPYPQQQQQSGIGRQPYQYHHSQQFRAGQQQPQQFYQPRFDGDFDFEKANQQFQTIGDLGDKIAELGLNEIEKLPSVRGSARGSEERSISSGSTASDKNIGSVIGAAANKSPPVVAVVAENFYDKNSSFFDNISCDALEREEGKNNRVDWKKERITNQETFGQMAVRTMMHHHNNHHYQRGGGRGGAGGPWASPAAYRGGGGYNNYHLHNSQHHYYYQQPQHRNHYHNNNSNNRFGTQRHYQAAAAATTGAASAQHQQMQQ